MIAIPCEAVCEHCGKRAKAIVEVPGAGQVRSGLFGIGGGTLGDLKTVDEPEPWRITGTVLPDAITCSVVCEEAYLAKKKAEADERERREQERREKYK